MAKQYDKQFKLEAVQYYQDHKDLGLVGEAKEIARLKRELRDTRNALDVLKKAIAFWEINGSRLHRSYSKGGENRRRNAPCLCLRNVENLRRIKIRIS